MSDLLKQALDVPFTFDQLRDPEWQPTREDYRSFREAAVVALAAERARADGLADALKVLGKHEWGWQDDANGHTRSYVHLADCRLCAALAGVQAGRVTPEVDPLAGLPPDLAAVLRDQSVIVPQDARVFELIAQWANAPSNTASAHLPADPAGRVTLTAAQAEQTTEVVMRAVNALRTSYRPEIADELLVALALLRPPAREETGT